MLASWMGGRKAALQIYGPPETERIVNALLTQVYDKDICWRATGEPALGGWKPIVAQDVIAGPIVDTGRWRVSAETVNHGDGSTSAGLFERWTCLGYGSRPMAK